MRYDPTEHITTQRLADLLGIPAERLSTRIWSGGPDAPKRLGRATVDGRQQSLYNLRQALAWVDGQRVDIVDPTRERVPPREVKPLREQGTYTLSPQLTINQQRAGELYPHRLITPVGIGNGVDHGQNKRRFAL